MTDCFTEDDDVEDDGEVEAVEAEATEDEPAATVTTEKNQRKASATPAATTSASPTKSIGVVEYIVDQKGAGSESLVVKSSGNKGTSSVLSGLSHASSAAGSRRGSLVSPRRSLLQRHLANTQARPTTHSHPLFPNYSRTMPSLPAFDTQINLAAVNADLGLAALNVADFNLNAELWHASGLFPVEAQPVMYDPYVSFASMDASHSIPRYTTSLQQPGRPAYQMDSTQAMNTVVSDLFSDVSMF